MITKAECHDVQGNLSAAEINAYDVGKSFENGYSKH